MMGGLGVLLTLDTFEVYGTAIYTLCNDICDGDLPKTLAVLRATQLGFFDKGILHTACNREDRSGKALVPVDELYMKVKQQLPNFDTQSTTTN
jgi:hypothetical protein